MDPYTPNTPKCPHCGKELRPRHVYVLGRKMQIGYDQCLCPGAVAEYEKRKDKALKAKQEALEKKLHERVIRAGIPERYRRAKTDRADLVAQSKEAGLYLYGPVGSGKTYLACALGIEAIRSGRRARYIKAGTISALLSYSSSEEMLEMFKAPDLLIIDDLGMDNVSEWSTSRMRLAIDVRYDTGKPTIITSNYSRNELAALVAKADDNTARAIASRIVEMTTPVEIAGKDRRLYA